MGPSQLTIGDARRCSAADAFLNPARSRANLTIKTRALVTNIVFDGDRAIGVDYVRLGKTHRALAGEVVLSAGALNSPRLLMLSGVGPEAELARHGIGVKIASHAGDVAVGKQAVDTQQRIVGALDDVSAALDQQIGRPIAQLLVQIDQWPAPIGTGCVSARRRAEFGARESARSRLVVAAAPVFVARHQGCECCNLVGSAEHPALTCRGGEGLVQSSG